LIAGSDTEFGEWPMPAVQGRKSAIVNVYVNETEVDVVVKREG
jgi:hypothetical protein